MAKKNNFKLGLINPLLLAIEWLLIDWWLLRLFSIFYIPTNKYLKSFVREKIEGDLVTFINGGRVSGGALKAYNKEELELALYYAEVAALKSSPLFYSLLSLVLALGLSFAGFENEGNMTFMYLTLFSLSLVGVYKYLNVRFCVYKMRRILVDAS